MLTLCGIPVIVRTLLAFESCPLIDEIIVAARPDEIPIYEKFREEYPLKKLAAVVEGGETRQESVLRGFESISDRSEFVAIHDGARCLVTPDMIERVLRAAYSHGAATAACHVSDTVKRADSKGFAEETIDRSTLWLAQTPQVFKTELYRAAAYVAKDEGFSATDDNMLAEHIRSSSSTAGLTTSSSQLPPTSPSPRCCCERPRTLKTEQKSPTDSSASR